MTGRRSQDAAKPGEVREAIARSMRTVEAGTAHAQGRVIATLAANFAEARELLIEASVIQATSDTHHLLSRIDAFLARTK